jgi:hypothetical protein
MGQVDVQSESCRNGSVVVNGAMSISLRPVVLLCLVLGGCSAAGQVQRGFGDAVTAPWSI